MSEVGVKRKIVVPHGHIAWLLTLPIHTGLANQARSAGDSSVNNPVCWGRLVFAPGASHSPTFVTRLHSPRFWSRGPHPFIVNPCNLYGWRG